MSDARARVWIAIMLTSLATGGCVEFAGYDAKHETWAPASANGNRCFEYAAYQPSKEQRKDIDAGVTKVCEALQDPRLDQVFAKAFDGTLASRPVGPDGALEMVDGTTVLEALREQAKTWKVHVLVVQRSHELARADYPMRAISLTPRRLELLAFLDTFSHELSHLVRAPDPLGDDEQWFKDGGHQNADVDTQQFASYFVGHAIRCLVEYDKEPIEEIVGCAETCRSGPDACR